MSASGRRKWRREAERAAGTSRARDAFAAFLKATTRTTDEQAMIDASWQWFFDGRLLAPGGVEAFRAQYGTTADAMRERMNAAFTGITTVEPPQ